MEEQMMLLSVVLPIAAGILVLAGRSFRTKKLLRTGTVTATLALELGIVFLALWRGEKFTLWSLTDTIVLAFQVDGISRLFGALTASVWLLVGCCAVFYMDAHGSHGAKESGRTEGMEECRFFGFYLIVEGVLLGLDFSGNLITFYVFYELMTLTSLPLVLHERTREAVMAGLKYLFYSVAGAFLALFGIFFLAGVTGGSLAFTPGGLLTAAQISGRERLFLAALFCMVMGFGVKAGMFPLHGWLPTAHPVAPAPASAVLSGVITKSGVLAIIRAVYFVVGPDLLRGTWVQGVWIFLSLLTVFMGSMMAYKEPVMKKRLAYSTVSQVSYILFGLSVLEPTAFVGALSHIVFHSLIKNALFLTAGAVIVLTGWTRAGQMRGLGHVMPLTLGCYTIVSLALVGIPPASGFVSKWYLASGALASGTGIYCWAGPVVLLISALLTAGYLLPVAIDGFFPGIDHGEELEKNGLIGKEAALMRADPSKCSYSYLWMLIPIAILTAGALLFGCFPGGLISMLGEIAASVL